MDRLHGQVAVVTGAANGIGLALAERLLRDGMRVVIADKLADDLARAQRDLAALGEVLAVETDVSDAASVQRLADEAVDRFGAVHLLCNNAGVGGYQRFSTTSLATWEWTLGVNLWGVIHGCHSFLPILASQEQAHIVNVASMAGFSTAKYITPYVVSKHGVVALTESLAAELELEYPHVGLSVVCPAYTATEIHRDERTAPDGHLPRSQADPTLDQFREVADRNKAMGQAPAEVADHIVAGVLERRLHVFPQSEWVPRIMQRPAAILASVYPLPYAPHIRQEVVAPPPLNAITD